jgi:membrane protein YqaA with SNARE-associated domain
LPVSIKNTPPGDAIPDHSIANLAQLIMHAITFFGVSGIALMMLLESTLVPIPSEIVMPFAGIWLRPGSFNWSGRRNTRGASMPHALFEYFIAPVKGKRQTGRSHRRLGTILAP